MNYRLFKKIALTALLASFAHGAFAAGSKGPKDEENPGNNATPINPITQKPQMSFKHWSSRPETRRLFMKEVYQDTLETFSRLKRAESEGRRTDLNTEATDIRNEKSNGSLSPYAPNNIDIKTLNAAWVSTIGMFMQDAPAANGRYNAGYYQPIWNAISKVALEQVVPITPDGVVLTPNRDDMALAVIRNEETILTPSGVNIGVRVFLINDKRRLVGPDLIPVNFQAYYDVDGNPVPDAGLSRDILEAANLIREYEKGVIALAYDPTETFTNLLSSDNPGLYLLDCFRNVAARPVDSVGDCFKKAGYEFLQGGLTVLKAIGGGLWEGLPFTQKTANGASVLPFVNSLLNMLNVTYNSYLRQEDISPADIKELSAFVQSQSVTPNQWGEISPGEIGEWAYYPEQKMIRKVKRMEDGSYRLIGSDNQLLTGRLMLQFQETDDSVILPRP